MKVHRRDFLKSCGVVGAGTVLFNPALGAFARGNGLNKNKRASAQWIPSTCQGCTTWCSIEVYVKDGRAIKVRGNRNSKVNPGYVCPRGHMIPQITYDPDRIKVPMKRTNPKKGIDEDPQFVPITWDEALGTIADKILELRANNEPHKFAVFRGRYSYNRDILYSAVPKIIGSPNGISHSSICAEAEKAGPFFTEGFWDYRDYDLDNSDCVVLWGVDPVRSNRQVPRLIHIWGKLLDNAKVITIDPFLTTAAAKSHYWLPIKPGTDGALAVAIAHEILVSGKWDKTFVGDFNDKINKFSKGVTVNESDFTENYTSGLVKWWNLELKDKDANWAESITGISASQIREIADVMANAAPKTAVWLGPGPVMSPRGTYTAMAIHALNGLLGSVDNVGGTLRHPKQSVAGIPSYSNYQDSLAQTYSHEPKIDQRGTLKLPALKKGHSGGGVVTNNVANAMLAKDPYELKVVIGYWNNWAFSGTGSSRWFQAMSQLPFFAHVTTHASDMTKFADIVIPAAFHATEKWAFLKNFGNTWSSVSIQQPVIERLFEVKADENEFSWLLAKKLKDKGFSNLYDYFYNEFKDPETGANPTNEEEFAIYANKLMTKPAYDLLANGWEEFKEKGVVNFGPYEFRSHWADFGSQTGKFEFYSETLKKALEDHATKHSVTVDDVLSQTNYQASGELAFVPHYEEPKRWGDKTEYPFDLIDVKSRFNREGRSANAPWYYEFRQTDPGDEAGMDDLLKISPEDAAKLGVKTGDTVKITTPEGSGTMKVKVWAGVQPGTVVKTYGLGHHAYGKLACKNFATGEANGLNNNEIMPDDYDRLSGSTARNGGFVGVKIEKV